MVYYTTVIYYILCTVFAFFNFGVFLYRKRRSYGYHVTAYALIAIANLGYLGLPIAIDRGFAILANDMAYVGGCFFPFVCFMICADLSGVNIPAYVRLPLALFSGFIMVLVLTSGFTDIFYKSIDIATDEYGITHLVKTYGPGHHLYIMMLVIYITALVALLIISFLRKNKTSWKTMTLLTVILFLNAAGYLLERLLRIQVEIVPVTYLLTELLLLVIYQRIDMYDMTSNVLHAWDRMKEYAYIVVDKKLNFIGASALAKQVFPELLAQKIDVPLSMDAHPTILNLLKRTEEVDRNNPKIKIASVEVEDRVFRAELNFLEGGFLAGGYILELFDITAERNFLHSIQDQNEKLRLAEEEAVKANHAKDSFLASMSHEIRTPINTILGMNELIGRESNEPSTLSYSKDIDTAGKMLLSLVNDILDFSKIRSGKFSLHLTNYESAKLICDSLSLLTERTGEKGLSLETDIDENIPKVLFGDDVRIKQIIVNLLTNAVKYTNEGTITFTAGGIRHGIGKVDLIICVKDTGIGIRSEDIGMIFDGFERLDEEKTRKIEGTGLGLAITKSLVNEMDGNIEVSSVYGEGSTFTVTIPQRIVDRAAMGPITDYEAGQAAIKSRASYNAVFTASDALVLAVDDNEMNLSVFKGLLKKTGIQIETAAGGNEAFAMSREKKYDIIFMDHMMPAPDGIETMHMIKDDPDNPNADTPFIALTANAISGADRMYMKEGFTGYLTKPVESKKLENMVMENLPKEKVRS